MVSVNPLYVMLFKALASPLRVEVSGVAIEYGMYAGKYWLPRTRSIEGSEQISFARLRFDVEQAFSYTSINGPETLAAIVINEPSAGRPPVPDSLSPSDARKWRDSVSKARIAAWKAFTDSLEATPCDSTGYRILGRRRNLIDLPVAVKYPCDVAKLEHSADLPGSLYDPNEALFGVKERDALIADALPFGAQAALAFAALPKPQFQYGLSMTRYNRVEGFSTGVQVEQQLGAGYLATAVGRVGWADREPNVELSLARTNLSKTLTLTGYNRLVSAGDWGNPLSFSSSVSALLFGRDEGFYYRASGAELQWTSERGARLDWRLFGEEQRTAMQRTNASLGPDFIPNITAVRSPSAGVGVRWVSTTGVNPRGVRTFTDLRVETAYGDSSYGRAAMDVTLSTGLPQNLTGALTVAGGTSVGQLPPQRRWFLGGTPTIRGQSPDTAQSGNAFWMSHAELGRDFTDFAWSDSATSGGSATARRLVILYGQ